jgi:hypothetical protein
LGIQGCDEGLWAIRIVNEAEGRIASAFYLALPFGTEQLPWIERRLSKAEYVIPAKAGIQEFFCLAPFSGFLLPQE